jgi:hypothetical protein
MTDTDGYVRGKRIFERGAELQDQIDASFPLTRAIDIEARVWEIFSNYVFQPPLSNVGVIAIGWTAYVIRQTHLTFNNYDSGLRDSLVPNVRTAFEHAIYASLLALDSFDLESLERLDVRTFETWRGYVDGFDFGDDSEPVAFSSLIPEELLPTKRDENKWISIVEQVCDVFEDSESLYRIYRILSSFVHPNFQSAQPYVMEHILDRELAFSVQPRGTMNTVLLGTSLGAVSWSLSALNKVLGTTILEDLLPELSDVSELPISLRPAEA